MVTLLVMSRNPKRKQAAHKHGPKKTWTEAYTELNNSIGIIVGHVAWSLL